MMHYLLWLFAVDSYCGFKVEAGRAERPDAADKSLFN